MFDRQVRGTCPTCNGIATGKIYEESGKVYLEKTCPEHGTVKDILSTNAELFKDRMSLLDHVHPNRCTMEKCRGGIFKCKDHIGRKSPLAFIEITTRCNMKCPVCYADAESRGEDMPLEDIDRILDTIKEEDPGTHVILIGGEPTIHKDFFKILDKVSEKGLMKRTFIATNAITLADPAFCKKVQDAGIKKFYLGFDGTDREACKKIRGSYIAYDSVRKALANIRKNGKAWIIISVTAVRDLNVEDIPKTLEFAMDNSDIVKRVMISPEVYCGRINEKEDLSGERLTGDCVETYLRENLKVKVATISISLFFALLRPLKLIGLVSSGSWMAAMPSPFCGQMGLVWKTQDGKYHSIADLLVKDADKNIYEIGRRANRLADRMEEVKKSLHGNFFSRLVWYTRAYLWYFPKYFCMIFGCLNKKDLLGVLGLIMKSRFNIKKFKKEFFNKKVEINFLLGSDKFNYIWDKIPYCLTHHYRIDHQTGEVAKFPGCFVFSFRDELDKK